MFLSGYFLIAATLLAVTVCLRRVRVVERELQLALAKVDPDFPPRTTRDEWSA